MTSGHSSALPAHQYRRLRVRYERRADIHDAFLKIAGCLICRKLLNVE